VLLGAPAAAATQPAAQPRGPAGCVDTEGEHGCVAAPLLGGIDPDQMTVSPNGRFLYALQQELPEQGAPDARLLAFARDPRSGALHPLRGRRGCLENTRRPVARQRGPCERVGGLEQPVALVISPDGRRLYTTAKGGHGAGGNYLVTFGVNPRTGALRPLQCLTDQAHSHCTTAPIGFEAKLVVSPDSRDVYAGDAFPRALDVYRVQSHGLVLQRCLAPAPVRGQSCTIVPSLPAGVEGLVQTRDGSELYAAGRAEGGAERIVEFGRDPISGLLSAGTAAGDCVSDEPTPPAGCSQVALTGSQLSLSASGDTLYAVSQVGLTYPDLGVAALARDPGSGALSEAAAPAACVAFTAAPKRGCSAAPGWRIDFPGIASAPSGGLLLSGVEPRHDAGAVVEVTRSASGGTLAVNDVRACAPGACPRIRGEAGELIGTLATSPGGRSLYVAVGDGIAQIRLPAVAP
jgi:hypothetical protein